MRAALLADLAMFSVVASQPIFYLVVMGQAQRALSAPAFIELRQRINPVMNRRVPVIYVGTLGTTLMLFGAALWSRDHVVLAATVVSLVCLVVDVALMLRENVPLNGVIDGWSVTSHPVDWERYRDRWFAIFGYRQVALLLGFASVLVGAIFRA